jgi:signal transduction histidine kinase
VSHERRTPVAAIRSFAEVLLHYSSEDAKTDREHLSMIRKEIVSAHHGSIWVESVPGKESAFHVSLPVESSARNSCKDSCPDKTYSRARQAGTLFPAT